MATTMGDLLVSARNKKGVTIVVLETNLDYEAVFTVAFTLTVGVVLASNSHHA